MTKRRPTVVGILALFLLQGFFFTALLPRRIAAASFSTTITNFDTAGHQIVRFDRDGNAVDAHESGISLFGDTYYLYGSSYNCGFEFHSAGPFCGFRAYSSTDLVHWIDRGPLFDPTTQYWQDHCSAFTSVGCFRPHVIYNVNTNRYVLWFNSADAVSSYRVLESISPTGPFVELSTPHLAINGDLSPDTPPSLRGGNGDENLFVDDDNLRTAYLVYTDWRRGGDIVVEKLDQQYESGTEQFVRLALAATEAPAMFKRNGHYYITVSDPNCVYCNGTGTSYMTAPTPLGPWTGIDLSPPPVLAK